MDWLGFSTSKEALLEAGWVERKTQPTQYWLLRNINRPLPDLSVSLLQHPVWPLVIRLHKVRGELVIDGIYPHKLADRASHRERQTLESMDKKTLAQLAVDYFSVEELYEVILSRQTQAKKRKTPSEISLGAVLEKLKALHKKPEDSDCDIDDVKGVLIYLSDYRRKRGNDLSAAS